METHNKTHGNTDDVKCPVKKGAGYDMTDEGQFDSGEMITKTDYPRSRSASSLSILECATQDVSSMDTDNSEWVCIDLTADSGACDSVMLSKGPCEEMRINPSVQSERRLQYQVANAEPPPVLWGAEAKGVDRRRIDDQGHGDTNCRCA